MPVKKEGMNRKTEKNLQIIKGIVISNKLPKTVTVLVESRKMHPMYKKTFTRSKKYLAHDELGVSSGDLVSIVKTLPISKRKHFKIVKVFGKDIAAVVEKEVKEQAEKAIAQVLPEGKEVVVGNKEAIKKEKLKRKQKQEVSG